MDGGVEVAEQGRETGMAKGRYADSDNGGTGKREKICEGGNAGKQRLSSGEVTHGWDQLRGERRQKL